MAWEQGALSDEIAERLARGGNLLLVGEPGVGKSVVILEAIRKAHRLTAARRAADLLAQPCRTTRRPREVPRRMAGAVRPDGGVA